MKKVAMSLVVIVMLANWCVASPLQLKHIPSDAGWLVHADNDQFMNSKIGGLVVDALNERGLEDKLIVFKNLSGFDPTKDLAGITIYGSDSNEQNAVAMLHGEFSIDKLLALLKANDTHRQYSYGRYEIHQWVDPHRHLTHFGSFASEKLIVIGRSEEKVKNALDVLNGEADNMRESDNLLSLDNMPRGSFLMAAGDNMGELMANKPHAAILRNTDTATLAVGEAEGDVFVNVSLQAPSAEAAVGITQMLQGIIAFGVLNENMMPRLAEVAQAIKIESQENTIKVTVRQPAEKVFELLSKMAEHKKNRKH